MQLRSKCTYTPVYPCTDALIHLCTDATTKQMHPCATASSACTHQCICVPMHPCTDAPNALKCVKCTYTPVHLHMYAPMRPHIDAPNELIQCIKCVDAPMHQMHLCTSTSMHQCTKHTYTPVHPRIDASNALTQVQLCSTATTKQTHPCAHASNTLTRDAHTCPAAPAQQPHLHAEPALVGPEEAVGDDAAGRPHPQAPALGQAGLRAQQKGSGDVPPQQRDPDVPGDEAAGGCRGGGGGTDTRRRGVGCCCALTWRCRRRPTRSRRGRSHFQGGRPSSSSLCSPILPLLWETLNPLVAPKTPQNWGYLRVSPVPQFPLWHSPASRGGWWSWLSPPQSR